MSWGEVWIAKIISEKLQLGMLKNPCCGVSKISWGRLFFNILPGPSCSLILPQGTMNSATAVAPLFYTIQEYGVDVLKNLEGR